MGYFRFFFTSGLFLRPKKSQNFTVIVPKMRVLGQKNTGGAPTPSPRLFRVIIIIKVCKPTGVN